MEGLKSIKLADVAAENMKISNINISVTNNSTDNVKINFNETANGLGVAIEKTFINITFDWVYEKGIDIHRFLAMIL